VFPAVTVFVNAQGMKCWIMILVAFLDSWHSYECDHNILSCILPLVDDLFGNAELLIKQAHLECPQLYMYSFLLH